MPIRIPTNIEVNGYNLPLDERSVVSDRTTIDASQIYVGLVVWDTTDDALFVYSGDLTMNEPAGWNLVGRRGGIDTIHVGDAGKVLTHTWLIQGVSPLRDQFDVPAILGDTFLADVEVGEKIDIIDPTTMAVIDTITILDAILIQNDSTRVTTARFSADVVSGTLVSVYAQIVDELDGGTDIDIAYEDGVATINYTGTGGGDGAGVNPTLNVLPRRGAGSTFVDSQIRENEIGSGDDAVTHVQIGTVENPSQLNLKGQLFLNTGSAGNLGNVPFVPLGEAAESVYTYAVDADANITHGSTLVSSLGNGIEAGATFPTSPTTGDYFWITDEGSSEDQPNGLYRYAGTLWVLAHDGNRWRSTIQYHPSEIVSDFFQNQIRFYRANTAGEGEVPTDPTIGINPEGNTDDWQRLDPYLGETIEDVEAGIRNEQRTIDGVAGREVLDLFNTNSGTVLSYWRLTTREDDPNNRVSGDEVATLPELVAASKWGTAPTGTKPSSLSWNQVISPVSHDSVSGEIVRNQELGADFRHDAVTDSPTLRILFLIDEDRQFSIDNLFLVGSRAVGPVADIAGARVIESFVEIDTTEADPENPGQNRIVFILELTFEENITVPASDADNGNIELYSVDRVTIHTIEGGSYTRGVLTIPEAGVDTTKAEWDGGQFVQTLMSTDADPVSLIQKNVITGNNIINRTLYGFAGATALILYTDTARTETVLTQNYTG